MNGTATKPLLQAYEAYYDELVQHVRRKVTCPSLAADIVQETYVKLATTGLPANIDNPRAFLHRVAGNLAIDHIRRERSRSRHFGAIQDADIVPDPRPDAERAIASRERLVHLLRLIDDLPPRCRAVFILRKFHNMHHDTIAERLGMSRNMVYKHLRTALSHLTQLLDAQD